MPLNVAAALGLDLILDEEAAGAGLDNGVDRSHRVDRVAIAGIGVHHDGDRHRLADVAADTRRLTHGDETDIGLAEHADRDAVTRDADHLEARTLEDLRRQRIESARPDMQLAVADQLAKTGGVAGIVHRLLHVRA